MAALFSPPHSSTGELRFIAVLWTLYKQRLVARCELVNQSRQAEVHYSIDGGPHVESHLANDVQSLLETSDGWHAELEADGWNELAPIPTDEMTSDLPTLFTGPEYGEF